MIIDCSIRPYEDVFAVLWKIHCIALQGESAPFEELRVTNLKKLKAENSRSLKAFRNEMVLPDNCTVVLED